MLRNYGNFFRLSFGDRILMGFNIWALLFGPLYYLAKGMVVKGLLYVFVAVLWGIAVGLFIGEDVNLFSLILCNLPWGVFVGFANYDYYLFKVKGKHLW